MKSWKKFSLFLALLASGCVCSVPAPASGSTGSASSEGNSGLIRSLEKEWYALKNNALLLWTDYQMLREELTKSETLLSQQRTQLEGLEERLRNYERASAESTLYLEGLERQVEELKGKRKALIRNSVFVVTATALAGTAFGIAMYFLGRSQQ